MLFNTVLFTGNANPSLAQEIATHLGTELGKASVGRFSDGALILFIALVVEGVAGGGRWRDAAPDSAALIERLAAPFERRLNRQDRKSTRLNSSH